MCSSFDPNPSSHRGFRPIRAVLGYEDDDLSIHNKTSLTNAFSAIGVSLVPLDELEVSKEEYDVLGVLFHNPLTKSFRQLSTQEYFKIGFRYGRNLGRIRKLSHGNKLDATIICHDSPTPESAMRNTIFHFFESLTLPSLLNIDLADVRSIARGTGLSFHYEGDSTKNIIEKLPSEVYEAKSALLHFTCTRDVTLEELYSISKSVTFKHTFSGFKNKREIDRYRRMNLKMGVRVAGSEKALSSAGQPRISLTAILFGL